MMKCSLCGREYEDGYVFCEEDGTRLVAVPAPQPVEPAFVPETGQASVPDTPVAEFPVEPGAEESVPDEPLPVFATEAPEKKRNGVPLWLCIALAALAVLCIGALVYGYTLLKDGWDAQANLQSRVEDYEEQLYDLRNVEEEKSALETDNAALEDEKAALLADKALLEQKLAEGDAAAEALEGEQEQLTQTIATLRQENTDLLTAQESLQAEMNQLAEDYQKLDDKVIFYDGYVRVLPEGDSQYHRYGCEHCSYDSFYIYNVDMARDYASPCPYCCADE